MAIKTDVRLEAPEGFKLTEIGPLPREWQAAPLRGVVEKPKQVNPRDHPNWRFRYVDVSSVSNETLSIQGFRQYQGEDAPSRARKRIRTHDVIFATVRPYLRRVAMVPSNLDGEICSTAFCVIRSRPDLADPAFVFYAVTTDDFVGRVSEHQRGTGYPAVTDKEVLAEVIPLPPIDEQRAIARVLSTIQRAIDATERVIAAARQLKHSLMRHLFTYGPVPIAQAEQVPLKETEIGPVPEHWGVVRLEQCATVQTGVAKGRKFSPSDRTVSVPYLRVANVQAGYLDLSEIKDITIREAELPRYRLEAGDVVLTEGGDFDKLGRGFIWRNEIPGCVHQNHIFAVRAERKVVSPEYLACLIQSQHSRSYFLTVAHRTTHLACINTRKLKALPLLIPCSDDQARIVETLSAIDTKIEVEEKRKAALKELFRTMLHLLMTGQVRVKDWDGSEVESKEAP